MARSNKKESRIMADEIRSATGLARVICSQIAKAAVIGKAGDLRHEWNSPSVTSQEVARAIRVINGQIIAVGPRGTIEL